MWALPYQQQPKSLGSESTNFKDAATEFAGQTG
jgi:hypothetical protein